MALAFTGHMVDLPTREKPRFPQSMVPKASNAIRREVSQRAGESANITGYASLARGGDILFHEICRELGLRTVVVLPFEPERFLKSSVEGVPDGRWAERFWAIWKATPAQDRHVLGLPENPEAYAICNEKVLALARAYGETHLIALWDGEGGDGPGGTAELVVRARQIGDQPTIINPRQL
jgi:hypothetical protein